MRSRCGKNLGRPRAKELTFPHKSTGRGNCWLPFPGVMCKVINHHGASSGASSSSRRLAASPHLVLFAPVPVKRTPRRSKGRQDDFCRLMASATPNFEGSRGRSYNAGYNHNISPAFILYGKLLAGTCAGHGPIHLAYNCNFLEG